MIKRISTILAISILSPIFILSCSQSKSNYLDIQAKARIIERQDHQKCISEGLDYDEWNDIVTEIYWLCRHRILQKRKKTFSFGSSFMSNSVIEEIDAEILQNLNRVKQAIIAKHEESAESDDNDRCIAMGFSFEGSDSKSLGEYYECRRQLIADRTPPAPKITHLYEAANMPKSHFAPYLNLIQESKDKNKTSEANIANKRVQDYPICSGLNVQSEQFQKCSFATDESRRCVAELGITQSKKRLEDKLYCQQQAYVQFPDNYLLAKEKSDSVIKAEEEEARAKRKKIIDKEERQASLTKQYLTGSLNRVYNVGKEDAGDNGAPKEKIYTKIELLKLREQFINQCDRTMENKLPERMDLIKGDCERIAKDWNKY